MAMRFGVDAIETSSVVTETARTEPSGDKPEQVFNLSNAATSHDLVTISVTQSVVLDIGGSALR